MGNDMAITPDFSVAGKHVLITGGTGGMEVLQLCRSDLIGWFNAPAHAFGFGSFQVEAIRTGGHPACGRLVPALLAFLPWRSCSPSADFWSTTLQSGGGYSVTPRKWNDVCARGSNRPTTVGGWTRPTYGSKASGATCTGRWTPPARPSTFSSRPSRTRPRSRSKAIG